MSRLEIKLSKAVIRSKLNPLIAVSRSEINPLIAVSGLGLHPLIAVFRSEIKL